MNDAKMKPVNASRVYTALRNITSYTQFHHPSLFRHSIVLIIVVLAGTQGLLDGSFRKIDPKWTDQTKSLSPNIRSRAPMLRKYLQYFRTR